MSLINYNGESKVISRICDLLNTMSGVNFEVVQTLPLVDISTSTIYLVPKQTAQTDNIYDEYINTDGTSQGWELIGTTEIDLSNYYTKTEADNRFSTTDENVKQVFTDNTNTNFYLLGSYSDSQADETDSVKKVAHAYINGRNGNLTVCRKHTGTTLNNNIVTVGNDIPEGTSGNVNGILRLYGRGEYYAQFYDQHSYLTNNRNYLFRDINGMMCLFSDVTDYGVKSNLNVIDNLIYPIYYHSNGTYGNLSYSTNFETGEYTVKGSDTSNRALNLKRYTQGFYLPSGRYKLSGCPSGGSSSKYSLRIYKSTEGGSTTGIGSDYGSGLEFTLTERTLMQIVFYVNANQSVDFTFRPKLERLKDFVLMSENLNDIVESGDYLGGSGNSCTNKPTGVTEFGMTVLKTGTSSCKQTLTQPSGTEYVRFNNNGTWGNWTQL